MHYSFLKPHFRINWNSPHFGNTIYLVAFHFFVVFSFGSCSREVQYLVKLAFAPTNECLHKLTEIKRKKNFDNFKHMAQQSACAVPNECKFYYTLYGFCHGKIHIVNFLCRKSTTHLHVRPFTRIFSFVNRYFFYWQQFQQKNKQTLFLLKFWTLFTETMQYTTCDLIITKITSDAFE